MGLKTKILEPGADQKDALYIREKVFIQEKAISKEVERDDYDRLATHVLVYKDNLPIGTGRLVLNI